jgi:hypothetical protein
VSVGLAGCWGEEEFSLRHEKVAWVHKVSVPEYDRTSKSGRTSQRFRMIFAGKVTYVLFKVYDRKEKLWTRHYLRLDAKGKVTASKQIFEPEPAAGYIHPRLHVLYSSPDRLALARLYAAPRNAGQKAPGTLLYTINHLDSSGNVLRSTDPVQLPARAVILGSWRAGEDMTMIVGKTIQPNGYGLWLALLDKKGELIEQKRWPADGNPGSLQIGKIFSATSTRSGQLSLYYSGGKFAETGLDSAFARLDIDLASLSPRPVAILNIAEGDLSRKTFTRGRASGTFRLKPTIKSPILLPDESIVAAWDGWYNGKFERLRLISLNAKGAIEWLTSLSSEKGAGASLVAVNSEGLTLASAKIEDVQRLFFLSPKGKLVKQYQSSSLYISDIKAGSAGDFLLSATDLKQKDVAYRYILRLKP